MDTIYLIYLTDYTDPAEMVGPFKSRADALAHYRQALVESGADLEDFETAEDLYLTDDGVRLGRVVAGG